MTTNNEEKISLLQERVATLESANKSAHLRIDRLENLIREDFKEIRDDIKSFFDKVASKEDVGNIKKSFESLSVDVKELSTFINKGKGYLGAMLLIGGVASYIVQKIVSSVFFK